VRTPEKTLVSIPTGDALLRERWLSLTTQPLYASAVDKLRTVEGRIVDAQHAGIQAEVDRLQSDRVEAETQLIRIIERLHHELNELLEPTLRAFVRSALNTVELLVRWQSILATSRSIVESSGFSWSAVSYRVTAEAMVNGNVNPLLALLVTQAQQEGAITSVEAVALLSGKQIDPQFPQVKR